MLRVTIKNLLRYKVLTACMMIGFILSTAIVSTIPIYTKSIMNQFIFSTFSKAEKESIPDKQTGEIKDPAMISASKEYPAFSDSTSIIKEYNSIKSIFSDLSKEIPVPILGEKAITTIDNIQYAYSKDNKDYTSSKNQLCTITNIEEHLNMIKGKFPSGKLDKNNTVEVMMDKSTFENFSLELDKPYKITSVVQKDPLMMKIVGVFDLKSKSDPFWRDKDNDFYCRIVTNESSFFDLLEKDPDYAGSLKGTEFRTLYDYTKITSENVHKIYKTSNSIYAAISTRISGPANNTLGDNIKPYIEKETTYSLIMWMFLIPVLLVVLFYVAMVSGFIVDADRDQIAVFKSRGASDFEILKMYFYQGLVMSIAALITGPLIGLFFSKIISYADGFIKFNSGYGIKIYFTNEVYLYSLITVVILLLTLLISVFQASKNSIVEVKRDKNKYMSAIFKKRYTDFVLLGIALYGYYIYGINKNLPIMVSKGTSTTPIDPLLYLVSAIFIIGAGIFLLRIYRYIIRFISIFTAKLGNSSIHISIINVQRDHLKKVSAMLFIVITVAQGIYNLSIAKNINTSYENTIKYNYGTDIIVKGDWVKKADTENQEALPSDAAKLYKYIEPSYSTYSKVEGIDSYTKVLRTDDGSTSFPLGQDISTEVMGIIPHEFGKVAWFDSTLLSTHWYNYLNALTEKPIYVLVSKSLSDDAGYKKGDKIRYKIGSNLYINAIILDIVDYWPGYENLQSKHLIIGNLNHIYLSMPMVPYEVWMKKKPGALNKTIYDSMIEQKISVKEIKNVSTELYNAKNDIFLKGTNSILTLSFISLTSITIVGFIIYWMLSLKGRTLQFGIYRSLGLSASGVSKILICEQILTLGVSIAAGAFVGTLSSKLFLPLIENIWFKNKYIIPVKNIHYYNEYLQFSVILIAIFVSSLLILRRYISTLKIHQAIKLGED